MQLLLSLPILLRSHLSTWRTYVSIYVCMYARGYNSPPPPQLRGPPTQLSQQPWSTQWNTLALFFFSHSRARGERKRERGRVLKVNCFLKVSPPRPSHIEIWTSFGARYCEQAHGPLFLSTCNYTRPGYRSQMFI